VIKVRSIGKKNIKLVKQLVAEEMKKANGLGCPDYSGVWDKVIERIPPSVYNSWEMAHGEIDRIIMEEIRQLDK
jgi:hypothetical protein